MNKASSGSEAYRAPFAAVTTVLSALKHRLQGNRGARQLHALDDFMLKDIGLSRADILTAAYGRGKRRG